MKYFLAPMKEPPLDLPMSREEIETATYIAEQSYMRFVERMLAQDAKDAKDAEIDNLNVETDKE